MKLQLLWLHVGKFVPIYRTSLVRCLELIIQAEVVRVAPNHGIIFSVSAPGFPNLSSTRIPRSLVLVLRRG